MTLLVVVPVLASPALSPRAVFAATGGAPLELATVTHRTLVSSPGERVSEFMVARDPTDPLHLAAASLTHDDEYEGGGCGLYVSWDGGRSWTRSDLSGLNDPNWGADPFAAFDAEGRLHLLCLLEGADGELGLLPFYAQSDDGGRTFGPKRMLPFAAPRLSGIDKDALGVDRRGHVYACYFDDQGAQGAQLTLARSTDRGETWGDPVALLAQGAGCDAVLEGRDGEVYVAFHLWDANATQGVITSYDGGETWQPPTPIAGLRTNDGQSPYCAASRLTPVGVACVLPQLLEPTHAALTAAVSPTSGDVFVAFDTFEEGRYQLRLYRSADRGATFEPVALTLPAELECATCNLSRATVHVDDAGRIGLLFRESDEDFLVETRTWLIASEDAGESWSAPLLVASTDVADSRLDPRQAVPEDPTRLARRVAAYAANPPPVGPGAASTMALGAPLPALGNRADGGDYWGMTSTPEGLVAMWNDFDGGIPHVFARIVRTVDAE